MKRFLQFWRSALLLLVLGVSLGFVPGTPGQEVAERLEVSEIARRVSPSVCLISTSSGMTRHGATGTGFLVSDRGWIATNDHVIEDAGRAIVRFPDGRQFPVVGVIARSTKDEHDLALLKIEGDNLPPPLVLGDSGTVEVGQDVVVIGHPLGQEVTTTPGIISRISEEENRFTMSAPISSGSSGSPVLNVSAEVIAVTVATFYGGQNLNLAVPSRQLQQLIAAIGPEPEILPLGTGSVSGRWLNLGISLVIFAIIGFGIWRLNQAD